MNDTFKGVVYSGILSVLFSVYFIKALKASELRALALSGIAFTVFLAVWLARKETKDRPKRAITLIGLITLLSLALAPISLPFAINTFATFTAGALALIYREELLKGMPAFMYGWIGAGVGFVLAILVVPRIVVGDVGRAIAFIGFMLVSMLVFLFLGRKLHYRPFNRYPIY